MPSAVALSVEPDASAIGKHKEAKLRSHQEIHGANGHAELRATVDSGVACKPSPRVPAYGTLATDRRRELHGKPARGERPARAKGQMRSIAGERQVDGCTGRSGSKGVIEAQHRSVRREISFHVPTAGGNWIAVRAIQLETKPSSRQPEA